MNPCGGTVPQLCTLGSMSGANARGASTISSRSKRSSRSGARSGRRPVVTMISSNGPIWRSPSPIMTPPSTVVTLSVRKPCSTAMTRSATSSSTAVPSRPRSGSSSLAPPPTRRAASGRRSSQVTLVPGAVGAEGGQVEQHVGRRVAAAGDGDALVGVAGPVGAERRRGCRSGCGPPRRVRHGPGCRRRRAGWGWSRCRRRRGRRWR